MVEVQFLGPINKDPIQLDIATLGQLKEQLGNDESMREWLKECSVAVNDEMASSLDKELKSGDVISILPPVCGG
ncbi:MAG: MoaD/ThiS family protein [Campylobacterota bacterium]